MHDDDPEPLDDLIESFLARLRDGESPDVSGFARLHPDHEADLRELLPMVARMEDLPGGEGSGGTTDTSDPRPALPSDFDVVGDYRILGELGRGGMGIVYQAEQLSLGRRVALKVLPRNAIADEVAVERFQREARSAAQLHHPNIVPIFEVGNEDDLQYYAMQFVPGQSLDRVVDEVRRIRSGGSKPQPRESTESHRIAASLWRGELVPFGTPGHGSTSASPWPSTARPSSLESSTMTSVGRQYWRSIAQIGAQVSDALSYAHLHQIIHRDIKPSNLLLDPAGSVWVTDFGLAKTTDDGLTLSGDIVGTLRFMSPERFRGHCDERADVFGLGATLYELLVLQPAFHSPDRVHLIQRITREDPRSPRDIDPSVPIDLETIVLKALEKDPRRRYQSAAELGEDLRRFLSRQPIHARRTSPVGRALRWTARNRALAASLTALALLLAAAVIGSLWVAVHMGNLALESRLAKEVIERQLYRTHVSSASEAIEEGRTALARQSLAEAPGQHRGWEWRHLSGRLDASLRSPVSDLGTFHQLAFSPDGRRVFYSIAATDLTFVVLDRETRNEILRVSKPPGRIGSFYREGTRLAFLSPALEIWDVDRGEVIYEDRTVSVKSFGDFGELGYYLVTNRGLELRNPDHSVRHRLPFHPWSVAHHPPSNRLMVALGDSIRLFDFETLEELPGGLSLPQYGYALGASFLPGYERVMAFTGSGALLLLRHGEGGLTLEREIRDFQGAPSSTTLTADGEHIIVGTTDGNVYAWQVESGHLHARFSGHRSPVTSLTIHPSSGELISIDSQSVHRAWPIDAPRNDVLRGHQSYVYPVTFSPDGSLIVSGGWDGFSGHSGSLRWWDAATGVPVASQLTDKEICRAAAFSPDGKHLVAAAQIVDNSAAAIVFDAATGRERLRFTGDGSSGPTHIVVHPDNRRVLTISAYGNTLLWDLFTGAIRHRWTTRLDGSSDVPCAISPDGMWVALPSEDTKIQLCDADTGEERALCIGHTGRILGLDFHPELPFLLSSSADHSVRVWNIETGETVATLLGHGQDVLAVKVSPDGERIASGGRDGNVLLWDTTHFDLAARLHGHEKYVYSLDWSPDGERLISGSGDTTVRIWETEPQSVRVRAIRERERLVTSLSTRIEKWFREGSASAAVAQLRGATGLSPRERQVARQLVLATCLERADQLAE